MKRLYLVKKPVVNSGHEVLIKVPESIYKAGGDELEEYLRAYIHEYVDIDFDYDEIPTNRIHIERQLITEYHYDLDALEQLRKQPFVEIVCKVQLPEQFSVVTDDDDRHYYDWLDVDKVTEQLIYDAIYDVMPILIVEQRKADEHDKYVHWLERLKNEFNVFLKTYLDKTDELYDAEGSLSTNTAKLDDEYSVTVSFGSKSYKLPMSAATANGMGYFIDNMIEEHR